jgi:arginine exporter protein ArgO
MRIFLFVLSIVSLLLATRQFSISEQTGQFKGALFLLLIGIQLLVTAALISEHREERTKKSSTSEEKRERIGANPTDVNASR